MAGLVWTVTTAEIALTAATGKTVLMATTASNQRGKLKRWGVHFDGIDPVAQPVIVELAFFTTAGTSSGTPPTPTKVQPRGAAETVQTTIGHNFTAEPTLGDVARRKNVHPQQGWEEILSDGREIEIAGGQRLGIKCTAPAGVNVVAEMEIDE